MKICIIVFGVSIALACPWVGAYLISLLPKGDWRIEPMQFTLIIVAVASTFCTVFAPEIERWFKS